MTLQTQIELLSQKELSEKDFPEIDEIVETLSLNLRNGEISKSEINKINQSFGEEFLENTIQGYGLRKPFGYAGDFLMIDKIYTYHKSPIKKYEIWDRYFHSQSAPRAVRNRKDYFNKVMHNNCTKCHEEFNLLNVASGPARDLFELYEEDDLNNLKTTCIEMDENAIKYAKELNKNHLDKIKFIHKNIFKHKEENKFDLIWSAGLFDYFNDKAFVIILKKLKDWLSPKGEIIVGNFNENNNPSRNYMEIFGDWYLHHRTKNQLIELAKESGFNAENISVGEEEENVNLFLHLKMSE